MPSYSYLCKKAGLPAPTGLGCITTPPTEAQKRKTLARETAGALTARTAREKSMLKVELDAMVARGELYVDAAGRYGLPEWRDKP